MRVSIRKYYFENKQDRVLFYNILKKYNTNIKRVASDLNFSDQYIYNIVNGQKPIPDTMITYLFDKFDYDNDLLKLFKVV